MQSKNKARIEKLEEEKTSTDEGGVAIQGLKDDESIISYNQKEYCEKEFKKLFPYVDIIKIQFK